MDYRSLSRQSSVSSNSSPIDLSIHRNQESPPTVRQKGTKRLKKEPKVNSAIKEKNATIVAALEGKPGIKGYHVSGLNKNREQKRAFSMKTVKGSTGVTDKVIEQTDDGAKSSEGNEMDTSTPGNVAEGRNVMEGIECESNTVVVGMENSPQMPILTRMDSVACEADDRLLETDNDKHADRKKDTDKHIKSPVKLMTLDSHQLLASRALLSQPLLASLTSQHLLASNFGDLLKSIPGFKSIDVLDLVKQIIPPGIQMESGASGAAVESAASNADNSAVTENQNQTADKLAENREEMNIDENDSESVNQSSEETHMDSCKIPVESTLTDAVDAEEADMPEADVTSEPDNGKVDDDKLNVLALKRNSDDADSSKGYTMKGTERWVNHIDDEGDGEMQEEENGKCDNLANDEVDDCKSGGQEEVVESVEEDNLVIDEAMEVTVDDSEGVQECDEDNMEDVSNEVDNTETGEDNADRKHKLDDSIKQVNEEISEAKPDLLGSNKSEESDASRLELLGKSDESLASSSVYVTGTDSLTVNSPVCSQTFITRISTASVPITKPMEMTTSSSVTITSSGIDERTSTTPNVGNIMSAAAIVGDVLKQGKSHTLYYKDSGGYKPVRILIDDSEQSSLVFQRMLQATQLTMNVAASDKDLQVISSSPFITGVNTSIPVVSSSMTVPAGMSDNACASLVQLGNPVSSVSITNSNSVRVLDASVRSSEKTHHNGPVDLQMLTSKDTTGVTSSTLNRPISSVKKSTSSNSFQTAYIESLKLTDTSMLPVSPKAPGSPNFKDKASINAISVRGLTKDSISTKHNSVKSNSHLQDLSTKSETLSNNTAPIGLDSTKSMKTDGVDRYDSKKVAGVTRVTKITAAADLTLNASPPEVKGKQLKAAGASSEGTLTKVNPDIKSRLSKALQSPQRKVTSSNGAQPPKGLTIADAGVGKAVISATVTVSENRQQL